MDGKDILLKITEKYPQWNSLVSTVEMRERPDIRKIDNNGRTIFYNGDFMDSCSPDAREFYVAQQVLHLQLSHFARGQGRKSAVWKKATDMLVNSMLRDDGFELPPGELASPFADIRSAEDMYDDLIANGDDGKEEIPIAVPKDKRQKSDPQKAGDHYGGQDRSADAWGVAKAVAGLRDMLEPSLQLDFDWFPGTKIRDGVLGYEFLSYPVARSEVLIDTSGSVDHEQLRAFIRGVKALLRDSLLVVGCFDTKFYGFHEIQSEQDIEDLELKGGGGTNFNVAVNSFTGDAENQIIFTDGYAEMPERRCDAIWIVYGAPSIHPSGGRVIYLNESEEDETVETDFLIT